MKALTPSLPLLTSGIVSLMSVMDFVDKNSEKLLEPKGSGGSSGGYSSMY